MSFLTNAGKNEIDNIFMVIKVDVLPANFQSRLDSQANLLPALVGICFLPHLLLSASNVGFTPIFNTLSVLLR